MQLFRHLPRGSDGTCQHPPRPSLSIPYAYLIRPHQFWLAVEVDEKVDKEQEVETWREEKELGIVLILPAHSSRADSQSISSNFFGASFVSPSRQDLLRSV